MLPLRYVWLATGDAVVNWHISVPRAVVPGVMYRDISLQSICKPFAGVSFSLVQSLKSAVGELL